MHCSHSYNGHQALRELSSGMICIVAFTLCIPYLPWSPTRGLASKAPFKNASTINVVCVAWPCMVAHPIFDSKKTTKLDAPSLDERPDSSVIAAVHSTRHNGTTNDNH